MLLPELAEWFQSLGFNTLIYDPRSIGDSDGLPRNHISPLQQAEDLSGKSATRNPKPWSWDSARASANVCQSQTL